VCGFDQRCSTAGQGPSRWPGSAGSSRRHGPLRFKTTVGSASSLKELRASRTAVREAAVGLRRPTRFLRVISPDDQARERSRWIKSSPPWWPRNAASAARDRVGDLDRLQGRRAPPTFQAGARIVGRGRGGAKLPAEIPGVVPRQGPSRSAARARGAVTDRRGGAETTWLGPSLTGGLSECFTACKPVNLSPTRGVTTRGRSGGSSGAKFPSGRGRPPFLISKVHPRVDIWGEGRARAPVVQARLRTGGITSMHRGPPIITTAATVADGSAGGGGGGPGVPSHGSLYAFHPRWGRAVSILISAVLTREPARASWPMVRGSCGHSG